MPIGVLSSYSIFLRKSVKISFSQFSRDEKMWCAFMNYTI